MMFLYYVLAAIFEILGCYLLYSVVALGKSKLIIAPSVLFLCLFAYCLTQVEIQSTGKIYVIYGAVYIISSILWMLLHDKVFPSKPDLLGLAMIFTAILIMICFNKN